MRLLSPQMWFLFTYVLSEYAAVAFTLFFYEVVFISAAPLGAVVLKGVHHGRQTQV